jgi:transcriptional regulator with XRE-family HTH domain
MFTNVNTPKMNIRFKKWMKSVDINANNLALLINVNRSTISHILSGRNKPSIDILDKIIDKYPDLNTNWLISGVGNISINNKSELLDKKHIDKIMVLYNNSSYEEVIN